MSKKGLPFQFVNMLIIAFYFSLFLVFKCSWQCEISIICISISSICFSSKLICSNRSLICNLNTSVAISIPKESLAEMCNSLALESALTLPNLPMLAWFKISANFSVSILSKLSGNGECSSNSVEDLPNISEKIVSYSGKIWSKSEIIFLFKSEFWLTKKQRTFLNVLNAVNLLP